MQYIKSFYINDRFFYACGTLVVLFMLSFSFEWLFLISQLLLAVLVLTTATDVFLLYRRKNNFSAVRQVNAIASLHNEHWVELRIKNASQNNLSVRVIDELPYQLEQRDFKMKCNIGAAKAKKLSYSITPSVRGSYDFGHLNLFGSSVLNLVSRREHFDFTQSIAVMPSVIQMREQELLAMRNLSFGHGENKTRSLGKSYEFDQLKNYVIGDDPRNINWKATSKARNLMLNHFEDERSQQVYSIIDKGRNMKMPFDGLTLFDYAINATLAFSNIVLKKHDKAGLISFSERMDQVVPADWSPRQLMKIQFALYSERYHYAEHNYQLLAIQLRKLVPNRSMIFLYTNFDTLEAVERCLPSLKIMNRQHRLVVIFFTNTELEALAQAPVHDILGIYHNTIARKFISEKELISKELQKHGITSILTTPKGLSANTINKYLELKASGAF